MGGWTQEILGASEGAANNEDVCWRGEVIVITRSYENPTPQILGRIFFPPQLSMKHGQQLERRTTLDPSTDSLLLLNPVLTSIHEN